MSLNGPPQNNIEVGEYKTTILTKEAWPTIKERLTILIDDCFPEYNFSPKEVEDMFTKMYLPNNDVVVLMDDKTTQKLVGFTVAHIYSQDPDTANIHMTGIASKKQGQKLVGTLMNKLENELKSRGVKFITRESRIANGYADAIERHYGNRIIEKEDLGTNKTHPEHSKRIFKIRI